MATVRLVDAIVPEVFTNYMMNDTMEKSDVFSSGIVAPDAMMSQLISGGGRLFNHPTWGDLDNADAHEGSDDPALTITPRKLGSFKHQFVRQLKTQAWQTADLVAELAGSNPMQRISSRVAEYWARQFDRYTVDTLTGAINSNIANNGGDMVYDITARTGNVVVGGATVPAHTLHAGAIIEGEQTMGDKGGGLSVLIMHSRLFANLKLQNLIAFIPNSRGEVGIPTYLGKRVVSTDNVPVTLSAQDLIYTTYLVSPGILGWAEEPPAIPVEVEREALKGNGTGIETLVTRRQFALHARGFTFTDLATAGEFPTRAEVRNGTNWLRAYPERKQVPWAVIVSKNG